MDRLFLKPQYLQILKNIFSNYCPNAEIWAYGSRIKGEAHDGSDLDLVVKDFHNNELKMFELRELIENSNIPILVDINEFKDLPKTFQEEIEKDYVVIDY